MNASKGSVRKRWECSLEFTLQIDFTCKHDPHRTSVDKFTHSILLLKALRTLFRLCRCISNNGETGEESVIGEKRKGLTGWMSFSCLSHCTSWIISSHNVFSLLFMYIKPFIKRKCQGFTEGFWKCSFYAYYVHLSMASRKSTQVLIAGKQRETEAIKSDLVLKALLKDFCSTFKLSLCKLNVSYWVVNCIHVLLFIVKKFTGRTVDADLGRPLGGAVQDALLDALHVLDVNHLGDAEQLPDLLKDLRLVPLADLHPVFHSHDDVLRPVLCPGLGALLCRSWIGQRWERKARTMSSRGFYITFRFMIVLFCRFTRFSGVTLHHITLYPVASFCSETSCKNQLVHSNMSFACSSSLLGFHFFCS